MIHTPVLIIGGGISGLVCAHALRQAKIDVQLLEASPHPGGYIRSENREGFLLELGPQSFSLTPPIRALCHELQIENDIVLASSDAPRYVLIDGILRPVPLHPVAFIKSSLLNAATKFSILRDILGSSHPPENDESVADFVRRKFSVKLLERLVGPFISGIYAGDPERLSLRSALPQLYEAEKSSGSILRGLKRKAKTGAQPRQKPALATFRQGNAALARTLAASLGDTLRLNSIVTNIEREGENLGQGYRVSLQSSGAKNAEETIYADHLVLATPADVAGTLLRNVNRAFDSLLSSIEYASVAVVSLGYRREDVGHSLNGFGFLVPRSSGLRIMGTVWNSSLFSNRAPDGHVLLTSFMGGATDPLAAALSAEALAALAHKEIAPVLHIRQKPVLEHVATYPRALPQYNLGHSERLAALENLRKKLPNLWFIGNYLGGPSIGSCIEGSQRVAMEIRSKLRS